MSRGVPEKSIDGCQPVANGQLHFRKQRGACLILTNPATVAMTATKQAGLRLKVDGKWLHVSEEMILKHPGGAVIRQYANSDATHIFHAFHEGSDKAYKQLEGLKKGAWDKSEDLEEQLKKRFDKTDVNIAAYDISIEQEKKMVLSFDKLRKQMHDEGLMDSQPAWYIYKSVSSLAILFLAFYLQYLGWYISAACVQAIAWQQFGWLAHEYCHHMPSKNRKLNDLVGVFFSNFGQGFSMDWWKDKHNTHHAATNVIDHDGDIDLAPLIAFIPADLKKYKQPVEKFLLKFIPYQHLYFTLTLPLLRPSWCTQSLLWAFTENSSDFKIYRKRAFLEQSTLTAHWIWVLFQLYCLPNVYLAAAFFFISQFGSGFLIAGVVTFNHNSVDKYPANSRILNNFAALQILTTRNMTPGAFTDWLWGGLNYQVEHHLFPTMPRCNLNRAMQLVKAFCAENNLEYLTNDYWDGYKLNLLQLENMANHVIKAKTA